MNMISELRQRVIKEGSATITLDEFNQLQAEWITRTKAEYMVNNLTIATKALEEIENSPFDVEGYPTAKEAAHGMNSRASEALSQYV